MLRYLSKAVFAAATRPLAQLNAAPVTYIAARTLAAATKKACMDGNTAAAHVAYAASDMVILYPITPSSSAAEVCDEWAAQGRKNIHDQVVEIRQMQSEAGVAGALHGALIAGSLPTTFTTSQGFLLMIPNMFKISGEKLPAVFHVPSRNVQTHGGTMHGDFSDTFAARSAGFAMLCSGSVQEVMDSACIAHMAALKGSYPFIHFYEGFHVSHQINTLNPLSHDTIKELLDQNAIQAFRDRSIHPVTPGSRGCAFGNDVCFQATEAGLHLVDALPDVVQAQMDKFASVTNRQYHLFDYYGHPDAENVIVIMGCGGLTVENTVTEMLKRGDKVGVVRVRLYRPFATKKFLASLPKSVKRICVLDRTREALAAGDPLHEDVCTALQSVGMSDIKVVSGRYGFGGQDFTPSMVMGIYGNLKQSEPKDKFTIGIIDDVRHTSLSYPPEENVVPPETKECVFWGFAGDGTIGANHTAIKLLTENTHLHGQGDFTYDPHKTGGVTTSHLRFGPNKIDTPYLTIQQDFVACHKAIYANQFPEEMLSTIRTGGTFVLNCPWKTVEDLDKHLCPEIKGYIASKKLKFYVIDAHSIALKAGLQASQISNVMQAVFFHLSQVLPSEQATGLLKNAIIAQFKKKGEDVVNSNIKSVDESIAQLKQVEVPSAWATSIRAAPTPEIHNPTVHQAPIKSNWSHLIRQPADPILGITTRYLADSDPRKISLGVGAYRDDDGKPVVFRAVQEAEHRVQKMGVGRNEYTGIDGLGAFNKNAALLMFGENDKAVFDKRSIAGSGALRIGSDFLYNHYQFNNPARREIFVPNPTWANHIPLLSTSGCVLSRYRWYKPETKSLDFQGLVDDWKAMPSRSVLLVQPCAHNPTGVDPDHKQWDQLGEIAKDKNFMIFFDVAYQGFASPDMDDDVYAVRKFRQLEVPMVVSQSFSKSMGLYGQRIGAFHVVCQDSKEAETVLSNAMILARRMYSMPPAFGAYIANTVLSDPELKKDWTAELKSAINRMIGSREMLYNKLQNLGAKSCLTKTRGMFCYTGLTPEQIQELEKKHHVFMAGDGRASVVGIGTKNVDHLAKSLYEVAH